MGQSLAKLYVHLVFSTKERHPFLDNALRDELHAYIGGICADLESPCRAIQSVSDHVHLLFTLNKNLALAQAVMQIKKGSSKWLHGKHPRFQHFARQAGYGAFSVGESNVETVCRYIAEQEKHHRKMNFQDELRAFLERYHIAFDERYIWD